MRRFLPAVAAAVLVAGALAGCTAGASAGSTAASGGVDFQSGTGRMPAAGDAAAGTAAGSAGGSVSGQAAGAAAADRSIVTTGSLRLVTTRPIAVAGRVQDLAEQAGGRVSRSDEDPSGRASARLVLRIPSAAFTRTLDAIEQQGEVRDLSIGAADVTARVTDYAVRIANLRTSISRLQTLLSRADSSSALVTIEGALTERQTSLEQLLAEQRELADQVSLATLTVSVVTPAAVPVQGPGDFLSAIGAGGAALAQFAGAAAIGLGVALPWLAVAGVLGGAAVLVRRVVRRRARPTSA